MSNTEFQKPFSEAGRLNAELLTRKRYCSVKPLGWNWGDSEWCDCQICTDNRYAIKQQVNTLMGRKFYEEVEWV